MKRRTTAKTSWFTVLLIIAAVALWVIEQKQAAGKNGTPSSKRTEKAESHPPTRKPPHGNQPEKPESAGKYEMHRDCTLVQARNNDGDSFLVRLPDGSTHEFRLYFVDTPESAFKRYAGGDSNHERIRQQAAELGGITSEQAVEIGKKGKMLALDLLGSAPFALFTEWDSPFNDKRYHAFVEVRDKGKARWLHELLVERGLARIKTKPADLPDGTPASRHRDALRELERIARKNQTGVWGL